MTMTEEKLLTWRIAQVVDESPTVRSLYLRPQGARPSFVAGQYLTVQIRGLDPVEGKSYSVASAPHEELVRISVKAIGSFSHALRSMHVGDELITTPPYGFFHPEPDDEGALVCIAGGIGITPIHSIVADLAERQDARPLRVCYSVQTEQELVFFDKLLESVARHPDAHLKTFITRQDTVAAPHAQGRMRADDVLGFVPEVATAQFFVCGSSQFTRDLWQTLRTAGLRPEQIYTEGFF